MGTMDVAMVVSGMVELERLSKGQGCSQPASKLPG